MAGQKGADLGSQKGGQTVHEASVLDPQGDTMQRIKEGAKKGGLAKPGKKEEQSDE